MSAVGVFDLGRRVRAARHRRKWTQQRLASAVGVSTSTISRMELGGGSSIPLSLWISVGETLGVGILAADPERPEVYSGAIRRLAARGGWTARATGPGQFERRSRRDPRLHRRLLPAECMVVRVVTTLTDLEVESERLKRAVTLVRASAPDGLVIEGCIVILRTTDNIRRASRRWRSSSLAWLSALSSPLRPVPQWPGVVWLAPRGTHWLPAV